MMIPLTVFLAIDRRLYYDPIIKAVLNQRTVLPFYTKYTPTTFGLICQGFPTLMNRLVSLSIFLSHRKAQTKMD